MYIYRNAIMSSAIMSSAIMSSATCYIHINIYIYVISFVGSPKIIFSILI